MKEKHHLFSLDIKSMREWMIKAKLIFSTLMIVMVLLVSCTGSILKKGLNLAADSIKPEVAGMNAATLAEMDTYIREYYPKINSVLVVRKAQKVFENYYNGYDADTLFLVCSVTKTITSALIGIAIKEGYISGTDARVIAFFPEYSDRIKDPVFHELKIVDFLTMTDGLKWHNSIDMLKPEVRINPIAHVFGLSHKRMPGEKFNYNTLDSQILSGIITRTTGMNALAFADKFLFGPLGITARKWPADPQGNSLGGRSLCLRTRDMAKIGQLYLNWGNWEGNQIIPREWIEVSTQAYSAGGLPHGAQYGYHIWVTEVLGHHAYFAGGFGGQFIYVIPDLEVVTAITSATDAHREQHRTIVKQFIVPAITEK